MTPKAEVDRSMLSVPDSDEVLFAREANESAEFFRRFGAAPSFRGKRILDLGCGRGALTFYMARQGAAEVVGADVDPARIEFAGRKLASSFPSLAKIASFRCVDLKDFPNEEAFDLVVSKDAFEHLDDPQGTLEAIRRRLAPGGQARIGFGPLYRSPFGDHGWTFAGFPWGHLILPKSVLFRRIRRRHGWTPRRIEEIGLNGWPLSAFLKAFRESGLRLCSCRINQGSHPLYRLARVAAALRPLREYFSFNVYCVLEKPATASGRRRSPGAV